MTLVARITAALALALGMAVNAQPLVQADVRLEIVSGDNQIVRANSLSEPFVVRVVDGQGQPVAGIDVFFQIYCSPYVEQPCLGGDPYQFATSDAAGMAASPRMRANGVAGATRVLASAIFSTQYPSALASLPVVIADARGRVPSRVLLVSGDGQEVEIGGEVQPIVVRVVDDQGLPVANALVSFSASCWVVPASLHEYIQPCMFWREQGLIHSNYTDENGIVVSQAYWTNEVPGPIRAIASAMTSTNFTVQNVLPPKRAKPASTTGAGTLLLRIDESTARCALDRLDSRVPDGKAPAMLAIPSGLVRATFRNCTAGETIRVSLEYPGAMPEGSRIWVASSQWQPLATDQPTSGVVSFSLVDGGQGDLDGEKNGRIVAEFGLGFGGPGDRAFEDLWWGGPAENGWGVSIVQHDDRLLPTIFAYDASGRPTWYAMPAGSWNEARDTFSGALYAPRGKPIGMHDASALVVDAPVGHASIAFDDAMNATLTVEIAGASMRKAISRQFFGPLETGAIARRSGMWWAGSAQNGWGLVLHQQYSTLFALLFTYRDDGSSTWFAMPSGYWSAPDTYEGRAYRATGSGWPAGYDASRLIATETGGFGLRFSGESAEFDFNLGGSRGRFDLAPLPF